MECPYCTAVLPDEDLFCEECGQALKKPDAPLCLCGAPEGDLDDDGYCLQCGRRCRPAPGEHVEVELAPGFAAVSDRGLRHHRNEDRCEIAAVAGRHILVVCDGVSSSTDAHIAAETASRHIAQLLSDGTELPEAFRLASGMVVSLSARSNETAPSTTAVAAIVEDHLVRIAWLGDSRAFWISETDSRQITTDHSWLNEVVSSGELAYADAVASPRAHAITRWMGADADPEVAADMVERELFGPGWLLLCTDGLWNYVPNVADLQRLVLSNEAGGDALGICRHLVSFANAQGGSDNITVALLAFTD